MGNQCCASNDAKNIAYDAPVKKVTANQKLPQSTPETPQTNILLDAVSAKLNQDVQAKLDAQAEDPMAIYEGQEIDLPEIPMDSVNDVFSEFELKMPFTRTLLTRYMEKVENAERANGNQGFVTIQQLASELKTPVWQGLNSDAD